MPPPYCPHARDLGLRPIAYDSPDYQRACALRHQVLRVPLGLSLYDQDLGREAHWLHFGLFTADGELIASAAAELLGADKARIRQMAVAPAWQGQGIGRRLMTELEARLAARGIAYLVLHARRSAFGFYHRLGYAAVGDEFEEIGLPHRAMVKRL